MSISASTFSSATSMVIVAAIIGGFEDIGWEVLSAMRKAEFSSTRGKFTFGHNNHPIQNFYLLKTVSGPAGQDPVMEIQKAVFTNHKDSYAKDCKMKW